MYVRPWEKLVGKVWHARHRDRKLLKKIFGEGTVLTWLDVKATLEIGVEVKQKTKRVVRE